MANVVMCVCGFVCACSAMVVCANGEPPPKDAEPRRPAARPKVWVKVRVHTVWGWALKRPHRPSRPLQLEETGPSHAPSEHSSTEGGETDAAPPFMQLLPRPDPGCPQCLLDEWISVAHSGAPPLTHVPERVPCASRLAGPVGEEQTPVSPSWTGEGPDPALEVPN